MYKRQCRQTSLAHPANRCGGLVAREQHQRADAADVEGTFQGGEHTVEQGLEPVDGPGAVGHQICTVLGEQPQFDGHLVTGPDRLQVTAHPGLVRDHLGVPGVGLARPAVAGGGPVDRDTGNVDEFLPVIEQKLDQQGGLAARHIHRPGHFAAIGQVQDITDQLQEFGLVVGHPARQQGVALIVQDQAVVVALAAVAPRPYPAHRAPSGRSILGYHGRPRRHCSTQRPSRTSQSAAESSWGSGRPSISSHDRQHDDSHTLIPWVPQPYEWLGRPVKERRARRMDRLPSPLPPRRQHGRDLPRTSRKRPGAAQHSERARQLIPNTTARDTTPGQRPLQLGCCNDRLNSPNTRRRSSGSE